MNELKASEPSDQTSPSSRGASQTTWLIAVSVVAGLALGIAIAAWVHASQPTPGPVYHPQGEQSTGTWICVSPTGGQTSVVNPGNCGPNDEVLWCNVWEDSPTGGGKCIG